MERAVTFSSKNGKKLFGIVHVPETSHRRDERIGINLLNPGLKHRVAPNRLNVKLARELCLKGYHVLRFDPEGIGDSEGDLSEGTVVSNIWGKIQTGLFVNDVLTANEFFFAECGIDELFLIGNCGGAITALIAAGMDDRIGGLCLIDVPIHVSDALRPVPDIIDGIAPGTPEVERMFCSYLRKLARPSTWFRIFTLKTDFRKAWKLISLKIDGQLGEYGSQAQSSSVEALCREHRLNPLFFDSIESLLRRHIPTLFIKAEFDPGGAVFERFFLGGYWKYHPMRGSYATFCDFEKVAQANHVYSLTESQDALFDIIGRWLAGSFATDGGKARNGL